MTYKDYLQLRDEVQDEWFNITTKHYTNGGMYFTFSDEWDGQIDVNKDGIQIIPLYDNVEKSYCIITVNKRLLKLINKFIENYDDIVNDLEGRRISDND